MKYWATIALAAALAVGCGDELQDKTGGGTTTNSSSGANTSSGGNSTTFPNSGANAAANVSTGGNNGAPANNLPDPMFQNPCESGPLAEPIADCAPEVLPTTGDPREDCVRRINQFRWECQCLQPLERWTEGEQCADEQAEYDRQNLQAHKGFSDNICSPRGRAQNECPDWNDWDQVIGQCLQMMWDEGPGEDFQAHGHYINMSSTDYTRVACGSGGNWFVQNFR